MNVAIFIAALAVVIMIHESGHFMTAKWFDFKATKFFVGFGPTVWSVTRGETEYGIKALPIGGFVKIIGMNPYEEVAPEDEARAYPNKPAWQRAVVVTAGSAMHFPIAFLLILFTLTTVGVPSGPPVNRVDVVQGTVSGAPTVA